MTKKKPVSNETGGLQVYQIARVTLPERRQRVQA